MTSNQRWVAINVNMLRKIYGEILHANDYRWVLIIDFVLPNCFSHKYSALFIKIPVHNLSISDGFSFYLNKHLTRIDGKPINHLFDDYDYNDLRHKGYSKLSYHFYNNFRPSLDVMSGDTLIDICKSIFYFLGDVRGVGHF